MNGPALLLLAVAAPFVAAAAAPWLGRALGRRAGWLLTLAFAPALGLLGWTGAARDGDPLVAPLRWVGAIDLDLTLRADGFSLMFALLVAGIGVLILIYAASYLGSSERHGRFYAYLLLFGGAMLGLVLSDNLVALFAFWEMTSLSSFLLIGFWDARRASQDGALKALVVTAIGGLALLVAVILLAAAGGSWLLSEIDVVALQRSPLFGWAVGLALLAAATKSAQLPFHLWLPTAMEAPTPVSAYLHSATMVKAGVILVAKFGFLFAGTGFATLTMYLGLLTMFWGSYLALRQTDLKALLAYSTVSQLGILMSLYGAGASFAATAHLVNHAAFKAALFMVVGIIDHEAGSRDLRKLSGLARVLPVTAVLAVPAALSMAGLPPFGGFISKELFYESMLHEGTLPFLIAVVGSVMTFAYSIRFLSVFWGPLETERPDVHEASPAFWSAPAVLVAAVVLFGTVPWSNTVASWFTDLAAPSFGYGKEKLYLWHGLTPALGFSVLTWFLGAALWFARDAFHALQTSLTPAWNANTVYYRLLGALEHFAARFTQRTQGATFATHVRLLFGAAAAVGGVVAYRALPTSFTPVPLEVAMVGVLIGSAVVGVLITNRRLYALIFMGLAGFGSTLAFVLLQAPDLALTQLLIETVTVILFLAVFRYLPRMSRYSRPRGQTVLDGAIATGVAMTVFTLLVAVQTPIAPRISDFFLEFSKSLGGGYNVVNVILVDFRGYDTMGEIAVLGIVAASVIALLKLSARVRSDEVDPGTTPPPTAPMSADGDAP